MTKPNVSFQLKADIKMSQKSQTESAIKLPASSDDGYSRAVENDSANILNDLGTLEAVLSETDNPKSSLICLRAIEEIKSVRLQADLLAQALVLHHSLVLSGESSTPVSNAAFKLAMNMWRK